VAPLKNDILPNDTSGHICNFTGKVFGLAQIIIKIQKFSEKLEALKTLKKSSLLFFKVVRCMVQKKCQEDKSGTPSRCVCGKNFKPLT